MTELINFRDFGGLPVAGGGRVRADRLYRCGHMAELATPAIEHLMQLDFAVIADLRYPGERESDRSPWPDHYVDRIFAHDGERNAQAPHTALLRHEAVGPEMIETFFAGMYADLPFNPFYRPLFARTIIALADSDGRALIHCTAGKDRTGMLSALILTCLGVERRDILADYMRSSQAPGLLAMRPKMIDRVMKNYGQVLSPEAADRMVDVKPAYLEASLASIEGRCGSVEAYLAQSGIDDAVREKLRARLVAR